MTGDLFAGHAREPEQLAIVEGACLLRAFIGPEQAAAIMQQVTTVLTRAPLRQMVTPGGQTMSVAMSNCGPFGWVTDRRGYRYQSEDPLSSLPWPPLPPLFSSLAAEAAQAAGFADFAPDACLINRYQAGARMSLHQDRDEQDLAQPIVSISLGLPATFLFGGSQRRDRPQRLRLESGDVVVWGGPARLLFHGVDTLAAGEHPLTGPYRYNLTLRRAR